MIALIQVKGAVTDLSRPPLSDDLLPAMPRGIYRYVWRVSSTKQIWLSLLTTAVFLLSLVPLELQRQVVNDAIAKRRRRNCPQFGIPRCGS